MAKSILINQPRASYYIGGAELISFQYAKTMHNLGYIVYYATIDPSSIDSDYSQQYSNFKEEFANSIVFWEIKQSQKAKNIYKIKPGQDRARWNQESIFYNQQLFDFLVAKNIKFDFSLSYYILDLIFYPGALVKKNCLYLCGSPKTTDFFQGSFLCKYDKVVAITDEVAKNWQIYTNNQINSVATAVDSNRFKPSEDKKSKKYILYIGRLTKRKGVDLLIKAFDLLPEEIQEQFKLLIVGDGPELPYLQSISPNPNIIFTGKTDNPEYFYQQAKIAVFPSLYGEGLQGVILEAMASEVLVCAAETTTNLLLLKNRGFLISANDPVTSIRNLLQKHATLGNNKLEEKSREHILKNYNWTTQTIKLIKEMEKK